MVRYRTAGEGGSDDAQKAPPSSCAATASPREESVGGGGKGSRKSEVVQGMPVRKPLIQSAATATEKDDDGTAPEEDKEFLLAKLGPYYLRRII